MKKITLLALLASAVVADEANAQMKLTAKTHATYRTAGSYTEDSTVYFHSGTKGTGTPKFDIPEFQMMEDSSYTYSYNSSTSALELANKVVTTYNASGNTETKITSNYNNGSWANSRRTRVTYASNKPDTVFYDNWGSGRGGSSWRVSSAMVYTWNGNNVATAISLTRNFGGSAYWKDISRKSYSWNAANKMTDSTYATYASNTWTNVEKRVITYDASNKRNTMTRDSWNGTGWDNGFKTTYQYDANARLILRNEERNNSGWKPNSRDTLMYNSGNATTAPDTVIRLLATTGTLANIQKIGYEYLTNGLINKRTTIEWNGTTAFVQNNGYDSIDVWYWGFNVGVDDMESKASVMDVYPNPATDVLHINIDGIENKKVTFTIVNVEGRIVNSWQEAVTQSGVSVSITDMPAGMYILQMNDGDKTSVRKFVIQR